MNILVIGRVADHENEYALYKNATPAIARNRFTNSMIYQYGEEAGKDNIIIEAVVSAPSGLKMEGWQE